jgi:hypothetical protein
VIGIAHIELEIAHKSAKRFLVRLFTFHFQFESDLTLDRFPILIRKDTAALRWRNERSTNHPPDSGGLPDALETGQPAHWPTSANLHGGWHRRPKTKKEGWTS